MTSPASETSERWSSRRWWAWGIFPIVAIAVAVAVHLQPATSAGAIANRAVFAFINQAGTHWPAAAWSALTMLGDASMLLAMLSPLLLFRPQALAAVLGAAPLGGLLSVFFKRVFDAPRPATVLEATQFHVIGPLLNNHSFPSGHTIAAFAVAVAALAVLQRPALGTCHATLGGTTHGGGPSAIWFGVIFTVAMSLAIVVGISRVAVGAHWPVDVLAGAGCGWAAGLSGAAASRRWPQLWQSVVAQRGLMLVLIGVAASLLWRPVDYPLGAPVVWFSIATVVMTAIRLWGRARV